MTNNCDRTMVLQHVWLPTNISHDRDLNTTQQPLLDILRPLDHHHQRDHDLDDDQDQDNGLKRDSRTVLHACNSFSLFLGRKSEIIGGILSSQWQWPAFWLVTRRASIVFWWSADFVFWWSEDHKMGIEDPPSQWLCPSAFGWATILCLRVIQSGGSSLSHHHHSSSQDLLNIESEREKLG